MTSFVSTIRTPAIAHEFVNFMNEAWTPFHAVAATKQLLLNAGFTELDERQQWNLTVILTCTRAVIIPFLAWIKTLLFKKSIIFGRFYCWKPIPS